MKYIRRIVYSLLLTAAANALPLVWLLYADGQFLAPGGCFCLWRRRFSG